MRIGIVNDSPLAAETLRRAVAESPQNRVVWSVSDGAAAVRSCARETPDLILMDLLMPHMDGVEATRRIMAATPCAIVIVTANSAATVRLVYEAMGFGALDVVDTPEPGSGDARRNLSPLLAKIETIRKLVGEPAFGEAAALPAEREAGRATGDVLIAIGASAGGPAALATLLSALPESFPAALVVVQHVDDEFVAGMAEWLASQCALPVRVAEEGDAPAPGGVLVAATDRHLTLKSPNWLGYTEQPLESPYRPSVDVFFASVSRLWRGEAIGVILSGMGADGAAGLKLLRDGGRHTIAQDRGSAVYGMPKAAALLGAAVDVLPLEAIAPRLIALAGSAPRAEDADRARA